MSKTSQLGIPEIVVYKDYVTVCGVRVDRPESISVNQWTTYWERCMQ